MLLSLTFLFSLYLHLFLSLSLNFSLSSSPHSPDRIPFYEIIFETTVADQTPRYPKSPAKDPQQDQSAEGEALEEPGNNDTKKKSGITFLTLATNSILIHIWFPFLLANLGKINIYLITSICFQASHYVKTITARAI